MYEISEIYIWNQSIESIYIMGSNGLCMGFVGYVWVSDGFWMGYSWVLWVIHGFCGLRVGFGWVLGVRPTTTSYP